MLTFMPGNEPAIRTDDSPPRQPVAVSQDVAHGPRRARMAGFLGDLAVGDDVAGAQPAQDGQHIVFERHRGLILPRRTGTP